VKTVFLFSRTFFIKKNICSPDAENPPLLTKLLDRVHAFIKLVDSSIVTARVGHHIATTAIMMCDPENKEWEIVLVDSIRELSSKGSEMAREIATGFADIDQVLYKVNSN